MRQYFWTVMLLLGQSVAQSATPTTMLAGSDQITSVTLRNGMQIIVWPDHDVPSVAHVGV